MSIVGNAVAIAKGMGITLGEAFKPTEVENYPDGKGPLRGAVFQERYCVEACPTDAITHGHGFELASLNATNMVMRKEDLLVPVQTGIPNSAREEAEALA